MKYLNLILQFLTGVMIFTLLYLANMFLFKLVIYFIGIYLILIGIKFFLFDEEVNIKEYDLLKISISFFGGILILLLETTSLELTLKTLIIYLGFTSLSFSILFNVYNSKSHKFYIGLLISILLLSLGIIFNLGETINIILLLAHSNILVPGIIILLGLNILFNDN